MKETKLLQIILVDPETSQIIEQSPLFLDTKTLYTWQDLQEKRLGSEHYEDWELSSQSLITEI